MRRVLSNGLPRNGRTVAVATPAGRLHFVWRLRRSLPDGGDHRRAAKSLTSFPCITYEPKSFFAYFLDFEIEWFHADFDIGDQDTIFEIRHRYHFIKLSFISFWSDQSNLVIPDICFE